MTDKRKQIDKAYLLQKEYGQDSLNYLREEITLNPE